MKRFLLGPAHVVYLFLYFYFYLLFIFLFASRGHSVALFALLHTSNPLTPADNVNCLPPLGTPAVHTATPSLCFLSPPSSHCARGACVFFYLFFLTLTVLAGCAWEPQCLTLMTKVSVNASPAQSALSPSSSSVCLLVCQSEHDSHRLASSHFISSHLPTQGSISVHCFYLLASPL